MTRQEALEKLELDEWASPSVIASTYQELYNEFQMRITNAPTEHQRELYRKKLGELDEANRLLSDNKSPDELSAELPGLAQLVQVAAQKAKEPEQQLGQAEADSQPEVDDHANESHADYEHSDEKTTVPKPQAQRRTEDLATNENPEQNPVTKPSSHIFFFISAVIFSLVAMINLRVVILTNFILIGLNIYGAVLGYRELKSGWKGWAKFGFIANLIAIPLYFILTKLIAELT